MEKLNSVVDFNEFGARFESAFSQSGLTEVDLAKRIDCAQSTVGRIRRREREPGALLLARAALEMGRTPNDLLLTNEDEWVVDASFDVDERAELARMIETLRVLKRRSSSPHSPVMIYAAALRAVEEQTRDEKVVALPVGTVIKKDGPITAYDAPVSGAVVGKKKKAGA